MHEKTIAILAVLAVAFAAVVAFAPSQADDSDATVVPGTNKLPLVYGQGANGVRAILYDDCQLMIDMNDVTASSVQGKSNLYTFKVTNAFTEKQTVGTSEVTSDTVMLVHQATNQGKLYIDLVGIGESGADMCVAGSITVKINSEDTSDEFSDEIQVTMTDLGKPMTFKIYDGSTTDTGKTFATQEKVNTLGQTFAGVDTEITNKDGDNETVVVARGADLALNTSSDTLKVENLIDDNGVFELIGWTVNKTDTELSLDLKNHTIEEIIYAYADAGLTGKSQTSEMVFYGCYGEKTYKVRLYDSDSSETVLGNKYIQTPQSPEASKKTATVTAGVEAYVNLEVDANGYAILRIQQTAGDHASYVYTFKHQALKDDGTADGNADGTTQDEKEGKTVLNLGENKGYCTIQHLASGVYKISSVKKDLNIEVTATSNAVAPLSYNLSVDYVRNYTDAGSARVSLDLYDANISANDTLKIDGTYYRNTTDGIRTYGQLSTINSSVGTVYAYVDQQMDYSTVGGKTGADGTADTAPTNFAQGNMAIGTASGSSYDLVINLPKINGTNVFFYAAQAVWSDGDDVVAETPWAIAESATGAAPTVP